MTDERTPEEIADEEKSGENSEGKKIVDKSAELDAKYEKRYNDLQPKFTEITTELARLKDEMATKAKPETPSGEQTPKLNPADLTVDKIDGVIGKWEADGFNTDHLLAMKAMLIRLEGLEGYQAGNKVIGEFSAKHPEVTPTDFGEIRTIIEKESTETDPIGLNAGFLIWKSRKEAGLKAKDKKDTKDLSDKAKNPDGTEIEIKEGDESSFSESYTKGIFGS